MTCSFKILVDSPTRAYLFHFNNHCPTLDYFSLFRQDTLHLAVVGRGDGVLHLHGGEDGERLLCLHLLALLRAYLDDGSRHRREQRLPLLRAMTAMRGRCHVRRPAAFQAIALPSEHDQRRARLSLDVETLLLRASPEQDQAALLGGAGDGLRHLAIHAHTPRRLLRISERGERDAMLFLPVAIGERARLAHHAPGATGSPWTDGHPAMRVERRNLEGYPVSRCQPVLPALLDFGRDVVEGRRQQHRTRQRLFAPRPGRSEEHTSELQSLAYLVCRLLLEKKKIRCHHSNSDTACCRHALGP